MATSLTTSDQYNPSPSMMPAQLSLSIIMTSSAEFITMHDLAGHHHSIHRSQAVEFYLDNQADLLIEQEEYLRMVDEDISIDDPWSPAFYHECNWRSVLQ